MGGFNKTIGEDDKPEPPIEEDGGSFLLPNHEKILVVLRGVKHNETECAAYISS